MAQNARGPNHYRGSAIPPALCSRRLPRAPTLPHAARVFAPSRAYRRLADGGQVCYLQFGGSPEIRTAGRGKQWVEIRITGSGSAW